jgi:MYXO-CTERM domain-containing protein
MRSTRRALVGGVVCALSIGAVAQVAHAAPPEPSRAHPRLFLDTDTVTRLKALASRPGSAVARAVTRCNDVIANPGRYATGGTQGFDFHFPFGACAISWIATENPQAGAAAVKYFRAFVDDKMMVGDGAGGDTAVRSDFGFAMRAYGPYTAIAYDWLHDAPGVDETLRARARQRFKAWTDWYDPTRGLTDETRNGYNYDVAGANYHAGWLAGSALIAVAQAGEAGASGTALWEYVVDRQFDEIMKPALQPGGVLDGGDWPEGWQYGPLSVLEYAFAARALRENGVELTGYAEWESELVARTYHARVPDGSGVYISGDFDDESPMYRAVPVLALYAAMGDAASDEAKAWAQSLIEKERLSEDSFLLFAALAEARAPAAAPLPTDASTWYYAAGTRVLHARSDWSETASWMTTRCMEGQRAHDHAFMDAGNVVWSRGADHVLVDPSPYGSLSTLTTNAPTIASANLPEGYRPSQGPWGKAGEVGFQWARQTQSGVVAARCDWRGQLRFRDERAPDVAAALRDVIMVPWNGDSATIVIDRVDGSAVDRPLQLRFRTPGALTASGATGATARVGATTLSIHLAYASGGTASVRAAPVSLACEGTRGGCDVGRFATHEWRISVPGPSSRAIHVMTAADAAATAPRVTETDGVRVTDLTVGTRAVMVVQRDGTGALTYRAPRAGDALHVVVDAPVGAGGRSDVTATADGDACAISVAARSGDGGFDGKPLVLKVSNDCTVEEDATRDAFTPPGATDPRPSNPGDPGANPDGDELSGGCGCRTGGGAPSLALVVLVGAALLRRRR